MARDRAAALDQPPYGTYSPMAAQQALLAIARSTFLRRGMFRFWMSRLIARIRPGPVDVTRLGFKLRLHHYGEGNACEKKMLFDVEGCEQHELAAIARHLCPRFHFADLGANAGFYSLAVKARCPDAKIAAFEPVAYFTDRLDFNVATNALRDFSVVRAAVGAEAGIGKYFTNDHSLVGVGEFVEVSVVPLYEALKAEGFTRLDGLKIDVEGVEDQVLVPFFQQAPPEFWPKVLIVEHTMEHVWRTNCITFCEQIGYRRGWKGKGNIVLERVA